MQKLLTTALTSSAAKTWNFDGEEYELFNDFRKKNPEEDF